MNPCNGIHGSRHRINSKSIQEECKIWVLVTETCGYVVQFRPYQGAKKEKQFASSTKWGLGENNVLMLMECLTPNFSFDIFIDDCLTSFRRCLPTLELTLYEQQVCSTKIDYANALSLGTNNLIGVGTKLKESIFKNNNQISSTDTIRIWVLSTEWTRTWPSTGLVYEKMVVFPVCLNSRCCSSGCVCVCIVSYEQR